MNIALIGYGRMGHEIEKSAAGRGHSVKLVIDVDNPGDLCESKMSEIDVAIEFTAPGSAFGNISKCLGLRVPVVSGTTGWLKDYGRAAEICLANNTAFIHSSNFSPGVNILFRLNEELAGFMARIGGYEVSLEEIHHIKKLDSPSGTAISIAEGIIGHNPSYGKWSSDDERISGTVPIKSVRVGEVPGTHSITWDSEVDSILLKHEAKNRKGLALGAVVAAEFIRSKKGVFTMRDVMGF